MADEIDLLVRELETANTAYRSGTPTMSDDEYDELVEMLKHYDPENSYLRTVEPEHPHSSRKDVRHPEPMLSMEKAYSEEDLNRFFDRVDKVSSGTEAVMYRTTPKLDGVAGRDDGAVFSTRGNGDVGSDITDSFEKGIQALGGRGCGVGEIVMLTDYFELEMAEHFEHPRNVVAGIVSADTLNQHAKKALKSKAVHFVPYSSLPHKILNRFDIMATRLQLYQQISNETSYQMDGIVISVNDPELYQSMGATSHHHRGQIAYKQRGESAITTVEGVTWQVGRTGKITPVLEVKPVKISGATIRRVTAHNAGTVMSLGIGPQAKIRIIRSGEVIPKVEEVIESTDSLGPLVPHECPECGSLLVWNNDFLVCRNDMCRARLVRSIRHWFSTMEIDYFGPAAVEKLVDGGIDSVYKIYKLKKSNLCAIGFGEGEAKRLARSLAESLEKPVDDWRFLASFGINDLGRGDSKKLLKNHTLHALHDLSPADIQEINGFGEITSKSISNGLRENEGLMYSLLNIGFNLVHTLNSPEETESPISGQSFVFTGKMSRSRSEMKAHAEALGAVVQSGVNKKTDWLVIGENVGEKKIDKATFLGVTIVREQEYYSIAEG